ncbi:RepA replication protein [Simplicispira suum]|uniref:RepA replication protein n=1 Tax=Simplicispira suum TaxID=2109915 RepID=A0A2S0N579_9BURK|nr:replication initiator protein A [Simplicispira suum]AVO43309.1 RepA replication protein [Simplicispira suum]
MNRHASEREQLELFRAQPAEDMALRDAQDLMAYPFFSLAKSRRVVPIRFEAGGVSLTVEGVPEHGIATIWDADVLIWAASQIVQARDEGRATSRLMAATPHEILRFAGRGTAPKDYRMLRASLDRLQSTTVLTSIRQAGRRMHRFSWINEWREHVRSDGRRNGQSGGIELILPDWFYSGVIQNALVLTLDPAYFRLTGGIERWLYRLVRKHGGRQPGGWRFELRYLYLKSGSLQRYRDFALHLRALAARQTLPGYRLAIEWRGRTEWLTFRKVGAADPVAAAPGDLSTGYVEEAVDSLCAGSGNHRRGAQGIAGARHRESPAQKRREPARGNGLGLA